MLPTAAKHFDRAVTCAGVSLSFRPVSNVVLLSCLTVARLDLMTTERTMTTELTMLHGSVRASSVWHGCWNRSKSFFMMVCVKKCSFHFTRWTNHRPFAHFYSLKQTLTWQCMTHYSMTHWVSNATFCDETCFMLSTLQIQPPFITTTFSGEQGWRSGENARLPPMWPAFDSGPGIITVCGLSWLLVLSLLWEVLLRVLRFSPLLKNQHF